MKIKLVIIITSTSNHHSVLTGINDLDDFIR